MDTARGMRRAKRRHFCTDRRSGPHWDVGVPIDALYEDHVYLPGFHKVFYHILASKSIKKALHTVDK
jgi:hypothetical protein